ncbi:MAG: hypothetical protein Q4F56_00245 [Candidatus Saccharibacteria bacterium]|nr:hypothetical protein [Candidatus Saccharibacteria bacterium]
MAQQQTNVLRYAASKAAPAGWSKRVKRDKTGKITSVIFHRGR